MDKIRAMATCLLFSLLTGCVAPAAIIAVGVAGSAVAITQIVNLARDQYPDIDFESPAPVEVIYQEDYNRVWNTTIDCLMDKQEQIATMEKSSGIIRTQKNNLNDVSWIGKGIGKATFLYEYNIVVRPEGTHGVSVRVKVPFWEEKVFIAEKQKNLPEGSNMMRHIFFRNMAQQLNVKSVKLPDSPEEGMRYAPTDIQSENAIESSASTRSISNMAPKTSYSTKEVQEKLAATGYDPGPIDGIPGKKTTNAISRFQVDNGLPATGEMDKQTEELLF